jgi:hypothetical protein
MTRHLSRIAGTAALGLVLFAAAGLAPGAKEGIFSVLKPGMPVGLTDSGNSYEIQLFNNGPDILGYKVIEAGADYLVLEDVSGVKELRIPIYAIKSVVTTKLPDRK